MLEEGLSFPTAFEALEGELLFSMLTSYSLFWFGSVPDCVLVSRGVFFFFPLLKLTPSICQGLIPLQLEVLLHVFEVSPRAVLPTCARSFNWCFSVYKLAFVCKAPCMALSVNCIYSAVKTVIIIIILKNHNSHVLWRLRRV